MINTAKFGGSSLANATQFKKVFNILKNDPTIKHVVVSAPGVDSAHIIKITDGLIELANLILAGQDYTSVLEALLKRFEELTQQLGISELYCVLKDDLQKRIKGEQGYYFADSLKAFGEYASALILTYYLNQNGVKAHFVDPIHLPLRLKNREGNIVVDEKCFKSIAQQLKKYDELVIIPGFYGIDENDHIMTFARGGSDLSGAIIASSVMASTYFNYTDVDFVFAASPKIVKNPLPVYQLTYQEIRELSYAGFSVLHEETILPLYKRGIPINIKNTNNPDSPGTLIVDKYRQEPNFVTGLAGKGGFTSIYLHKYLMNREIGFVRKLLSIFEDEGIPFEHAPSGIDYITLIVETDVYHSCNYQRIEQRIKDELQVDLLHKISDLALLMIVGENIIEKNLLGKSILALEKANIKILNTSLAHRGDSLLLGVSKANLKRGIAILYDELFLKKN